MTRRDYFRRTKDRRFTLFVESIRQLSEGNLPEHCLDAIDNVEMALEHYTDEQKGDIAQMRVAAREQCRYLEALQKLKDTESGLEKRQQEMKAFLKKY